MTDRVKWRSLVIGQFNPVVHLWVEFALYIIGVIFIFEHPSVVLCPWVFEGRASDVFSNGGSADI
jgi:hypothetical protein